MAGCSEMSFVVGGCISQVCDSSVVPFLEEEIADLVVVGR
jgi:hypothetical protein